MSIATELPYRVVLAGAANVRDLGGYPTIGGHHVRRGQIFRADSLHRVTEADLELLRSLGLRTVIDLRSLGEIERTGRLINADLEIDHVHLEMRHSRTASADPRAGSLVDIDLSLLYRRYLELNGESLASALRVIARPETSPVLVHCFAGKDRTGVLAALVLSLLGVDDEQVIDDYAATSDSFNQFMELVRTDDPPILDTEEIMSVDPSLLTAKPETMRALLAGIRDEAGSVEQLVRGWGIDGEVLTGLRDHLLEERAAYQRR